jgi:23S rRNA (guanosine2251-2'-O)-methyltransferase
VEQLEGRNPVLECLTRRRRPVRKIWMDRGAKSDPRIDRILELAAAHGVPVERVDRARLDKMAAGRVHNGVIAEAEPLPETTTARLLDELFERGETPFLVLVAEVAYEHNLGAILRSSLGFGVSGVVVPTRRGAGLSPVVQRVAMGGAEAVPLIREGLYSALKPIQKAGIPVVGADMGGEPVGETDLRGPMALVLGSEGEGLGPELRKRCDRIVSIPLAGELESLNMSVAAALLMYEKRRQEGAFPARVRG